MRLTLFLSIALILSCNTSTNNLNTTFQVSRIDTENKLLIGTISKDYSGSFEYYPSENLYHCFYDNSAGLVISFDWGDGFSGESVKIEFKKNGQFKIALDSGGCGLFDSFNYLTQHQTLILSDTSLVIADTISAYIEYRGIQDIEGMKQRFKKYESGLKMHYGIDSSYFDTLQPRIVSIIGSFNLPKCNHFDNSDLEYHKFIITGDIPDKTGY